MTIDQLRAIAQRYLANRLDAAVTDAAMGIAAAPENPVGFDVRKDQLVETLEDLERGFATGRQRKELQQLADALLAEARLEVGRESEAYDLFCLWLLKAQQSAAQTELDVLCGDLSALNAGTPATAPKKQVSSGVLLSAAVSQYMEYKRVQGAWTTQTDEMHAATYGELVSLIGDRPVRQITKANLLAYYGDLPQLPSNASKKWLRKSAREVIDLTADANVPRIAPRSINKRLVMVRSLFGWMALTDLVERNPAEVLRSVPEDAASDARLPFTDAEVRALLARCEAEAEQSAHRYVPRVLAYSGLRLDEAAQLTRADIVQVDGVWCFSVNAEEGRKIKTATAKRLVPIHSTILADLSSYRDGRPEGNLWGLKASGRGGHSAGLGRWLGRRVRKITADKRKVIHSLRHSIATKLKATGVQEYEIESLLGHTSRSLSTGRYGKSIAPSRLTSVVELIGY